MKSFSLSQFNTGNVLDCPATVNKEFHHLNIWKQLCEFNYNKKYSDTLKILPDLKICHLQFAR